jgi:hypothetical protein
MDPANVVQSEALRAHEELSHRVDASSGTVADVIELAAAQVEWDYRQDAQGRDLLLLHVRDPLGAQAATRLAPAELQNEEQLRRRLRDLLDAALRISGWRAALVHFFREAGRWVHESDAAAIIDKAVVTLDEQRSGSYEVPSLDITSGNRVARLAPVACWVVGADGRVDLTGIGGREVFLLDNGAWFWLSDRPWGRLQRLDKSLFLSLLDAVWQ